MFILLFNQSAQGLGRFRFLWDLELQVSEFIRDASTETRLHSKLWVLADVVLSVGEAAGEDANVSCAVSLQPLVVNYSQSERETTKRQ